MIDRGIGALEVNVGGEAVPARVNGILKGKLEERDSPGAGVPFPKALLGLRKNLVRLCIVGGHLSEETCPELVRTVSEADGAVVLQVSGIALFVE